MGEVIHFNRTRKGQGTEPIPVEENQPAALIERKLAENASEGWRLNKKDPRDRHDLIAIARNLGKMRNRLPHGQKSKVLLAADFIGADPANVATYANNLTLPLSGDISDKRLSRLSPEVNRYINVAVAIEGDRARALAYLFRFTSFDHNFSDDWPGMLSAKLDRLAVEVAQSEKLANFFDQVSAANICIADSDMLDFRITDWLSETFHKTDFAWAAHTRPGGAWLYDRTEEGTPVCGAPLFVPKVSLDIRKRTWLLRNSGQNRTEVLCSFQSELFAAIVPIAASLNEPCRVECWLFERPTAAITPSAIPVWQVRMDASGTCIIKAGDEVYQPVENLEFQAWAETEPGRLFVDDAAASEQQCDLMGGSWLCMPATRDAVLARLAQPRSGVQSLKPTHPREFNSVVMHADELEQADFHQLSANFYPPNNTLAHEVTFGLADLEAKLRSSARALISKFHELETRVRSISPLA